MKKEKREDARRQHVKRNEVGDEGKEVKEREEEEERGEERRKVKQYIA